MTVSIYAIESPGLPDTYVDADVFSRKVRAVLTALRKADRVGNPGKGKLPHTYFVTDLKSGSAQVSFIEYSQATAAQLRPVSSVDTLMSCARAIQLGDFECAARFDGLPGVLEEVSKGASETFSHITFEPEREEPLRVDQFFEKQVERFLSREVIEEESVAAPAFFHGTSFDAFDGDLKAVDLRGAVWAGTLVLSGSRMEINCTIHGPTLDEVKANLNMRVWAEGRAIYSEESGLPQRLEIHRMRRIKPAGDLRQWRGKLTPDDMGEDESEWLGR